MSSSKFATIDLAEYKIRMELLEPMLGTVPKDRNLYQRWIVTRAMEHAQTGNARTAESVLANPATQQTFAEAARFSDGTLASTERALAVMEEELSTVPDPRFNKFANSASGDNTMSDQLQEGENADSEQQAQEALQAGWTGFHTDEHGPFVYDYLVKGHLCAAGETLNRTDNVGNLKHKVKRNLFVYPRRIYLGIDPKKPLDTLTRSLRIEGMQARVAIVKSDIIPAGTQFEFTMKLLRAGHGIKEPLLQKLLDYAQYYGYGQWRSGGYGRAKLVDFQLIN